MSTPSRRERQETKSLQHEQEAIERLLESIEQAEVPLKLTRRSAAWHHILEARWAKAETVRRDSDDQPPELPQEIPSREAAEELLDQLDAWARRASDRLIGVVVQPTSTPKRQQRNVNARMLEAIQSDLAKFSGLNSKQWAKYLKCSPSSVVETPTWKDLAIARERQKAERRKDRRRKPKASDHRRD